MDRKASPRDLEQVRNAAQPPRKDEYIPPKLPDTTNLVFMSNKNEYREMMAIAESVSVENRRPPLKKLVSTISQRMVVITATETYAFPKNKTPVPTKDFKSYEIKVGTT